MTDTAGIAVWAGAGLAAGAALAWAYLKSLWICVAHLPRTRRPALWVVATLLARTAAAAGFFLLLGLLGGWAALVGALAGFMLARAAFVHRIAPAERPAPHRRYWPLVAARRRTRSRQRR